MDFNQDYIDYLRTYGEQAEKRANYWHGQHEVWRPFAKRMNDRMEASRKEGAPPFDVARALLDYQECLRRCYELDKETGVGPSD